jgi:hypothetical protein
MFAVPPDAGREERAGAAGGGVSVERALDAPVVREIERPPRGIVEGFRLRTLRIAGGELPVRFERRRPGREE